MDEQLFRKRADEAMDDLNSALIDAGENHGFDVDFQSGAITVEFEEPPSKFIVSPNAPAATDLGFGTVPQLQTGLG